MKKLIAILTILTLVCFSNIPTGCKSANSNKEQKKVDITQNSVPAKTARNYLEKNGFVVQPSTSYKNMSDAYKAFRKDNIPVFLTIDSILHTTHIFFDYLLRSIEIRHLRGNLTLLTNALLNESIQAHERTTDQGLKLIIHKNVAFFAVAARLLNPNQPIPAYVEKEVDDELRLIQQHQKFEKSPIFDYLEDYSQYLPRGHYTRNDKFKSYFTAMMWYGRIGFYVEQNQALLITDEMARQQTRQALLIVSALNNLEIRDQSAIALWESIYEPTSFFAGKSDDFDFYDYRMTAAKIYGKIPGAAALNNDTHLRTFFSEIKKINKSQIISTLAIDTKNKGADGSAENFRLFGQRFIPDSYMFQNLVYPQVKLHRGKSDAFTTVQSPVGPIRGFPRGLDVMAVLGSKYALEILEKEGDTNYEAYETQLNKLTDQFNLTEKEWFTNFYWNWLYCIKSVLAPSPGVLPEFMKTQAWIGKQLNTALASWAELRHDTILYAKQSYTALGMAMHRAPEITKGYVEPYPALYSRIHRLIVQMRKILAQGKLLDKDSQTNLMEFEKLLVLLETISNKELKQQPLNPQEYEAIWNIGRTLEMLTTLPPEIMAEISSEADGSMALIADVHTDPNSSQVLEEAVGNPFILHVKMVIDGEEKYLQGPVFSYYEFKQPMPERLTDEKWQEMLRRRGEPECPAWTEDFIAK